MAGMATKQGLDMQVNVFVDDFAGFMPSIVLI